MSDLVTLLDRERIDLFKRTYCKGATDDELDLFISVCKRTGLSPEAKQIYAVKRWDSLEKKEVMKPMTSVDGQRLVAERTGKYRGQGGPWWCGKDGAWSEVWLGEGYPVAAKVEVYKDGFAAPLVGIARWASFAQKDKAGNLTPIWDKLPDVMLAKCAESQALRRAFPQELSGLYTKEEMDHDENVDYVDPTPAQAKVEISSKAQKIPEDLPGMIKAYETHLIHLNDKIDLKQKTGHTIEALIDRVRTFRTLADFDRMDGWLTQIENA